MLSTSYWSPGRCKDQIQVQLALSVRPRRSTTARPLKVQSIRRALSATIIKEGIQVGNGYLRGCERSEPVVRPTDCPPSEVL